MSGPVVVQELPDFDNPPVIEIVGAAQFVALPRLSLADMVRVGQQLDGYELHELQPELPPMTEPAPDAPDQPQFMLGVGQQPHRAVYRRHDGRFFAQLQRDRIAVNERRRQPSDDDPSSNTVWSELARLADCANETLVDDEAYGPSIPTVVEVTYVNRVEPVAGVWETHSELHKVLRIVNAEAGQGAFGAVEQVAARYSFRLHAADGSFRGRLHVVVDPGYTHEGRSVLHLNLFSRRLVVNSQTEDLAEVFEACHQDVVSGFAAITTPEMHEFWKRTR
jgi:uncharacterized protein (TIGR04255 family)